jgi:cardiolipin synthase
VVEQVLEKVIDTKDPTPFEPDEVAQTVREAFHEEVQDAVKQVLKEVVVTAAIEDSDKPQPKAK